MLKIQPNEIMPNYLYERVRPEIVRSIIACKKRRRIALGHHLSLVFENRDTVLFQIQEVLRVEPRLTPETIAREVAHYNQLLPEPGQLSATLFLEFTDRAVGTAFMAAVTDLRDRLFMRIGSQRIAAQFMDRPDRPVCDVVNYVRFALDIEQRDDLLRTHVPASVEFVHPDGLSSASLSSVSRLYLTGDLLDDRPVAPAAHPVTARSTNRLVVRGAGRPDRPAHRPAVR